MVLPFLVTYSTAKHAMEALAEGYHYELAPFGVESVIVEPQSHPTQGSLHKIVKPADADVPPPDAPGPEARHVTGTTTLAGWIATQRWE